MTFFFSLLNGFFYRAGGAKGWNTKFRDIGCSLVLIAHLYKLGVTGAWYAWALSFVLMFAFHTTYHSWLSKLLGYNDGKERDFNYFLHALCIGLAILPLAFWGSLDWVNVFGRSMVIGVFVASWSMLFDDVNWEETGRGMIIQSSLFML